MNAKVQHALPQERKRAKGKTKHATQVQMRSQADHRPISGQVAPSPIAEPQSTLATAPSITRASEPPKASVAVMAKRQSAILPRIGSTKTATEQSEKNKWRLRQWQLTK
jgi:hypothetical protein